MFQVQYKAPYSDGWGGVCNTAEYMRNGNTCGGANVDGAAQGARPRQSFCSPAHTRHGHADGVSSIRGA